MRRKNFTKQEDKSLCVAYITASKNAINGTDPLWTSVFKEFVKAVPDHNARDCAKLSKRWYDKIRPLVGKFSVVYGRVKRELGSGHTSCDVLKTALSQWKHEHNGKAFPLLHCWEFLQHQDQFNPDFVESTEEMMRVPERVNTDRPQRKKRALEEARNDNTKTHIADQMKQLNAILAERSEVALFSAFDDDISREFFNLKRQRILDRMRMECGEQAGRIGQHCAIPGIASQSVEQEHQLLSNQVITNLQDQIRRQQEGTDHSVSE